MDLESEGGEGRGNTFKQKPTEKGTSHEKKWEKYLIEHLQRLGMSLPCSRNSKSGIVKATTSKHITAIRQKTVIIHILVELWTTCRTV